MNDLIKALTILSKYNDLATEYCPTHCEHDSFLVCGVQWEELSEKDKVDLEKLGFHENPNGIESFRFGSC